MKTCSKCHIEKDESEFGSTKNKYGKSYKRNTCKECHGIRYKDYFSNRYKKIKRQEGYKLNGINRGLKDSGKKKCGKCGIIKDISFFYKPPNGKIYSMCKDCHPQYCWKKSKEGWAKYYKENKAAYKKRFNNYRSKDKDRFDEMARIRMKRQREKNPQKFKERYKNWIAKLPAAYIKKRLIETGTPINEIEKHPFLLDKKKLDILIFRSHKLKKQKS